MCWVTGRYAPAPDGQESRRGGFEHIHYFVLFRLAVLLAGPHFHIWNGTHRLGKQQVADGHELQDGESVYQDRGDLTKNPDARGVAVLRLYIRIASVAWLYFAAMFAISSSIRENLPRCYQATV